jgi:CheY-like chemotaxis protein
MMCSEGSEWRQAREAPAVRDVLVVEDDPDVGELLVEALELGGFRARVEPNGRTAIEYLRGGGRVDLILLDMTMPVLDGWGFRREQRGSPRIADIPVIVLTADGDARAKAASIRAQGFLSKPVSLEALLCEVERVLCVE